MSFLEWFASKLTPKTVAEKQTDNPRHAILPRTFEEHPTRGMTPASLANALLAAEQGDLVAQAEIFMDIEEKDAHIGAEMSKRKMAVKKLDWTLQPPRDASAKEKKNTKLLEALLRDELNIGEIRFNLLDAVGHGYSCIELEWKQNRQGLWYPAKTEHRPATWFTTPRYSRNELTLRDSGNPDGEPLQPFGWIPHIHKTRSGYLARSGLYRSLVWTYLYKNYSVRDLAEFLEVYGLPIRIGKYPANADDKQKSALLKAILSIGHNAAGIIPDSMQVELSQVVAQGNADAFMKMIDWCEASQSKAILGGTLTSQTGANGNRSLGDVHNQVRHDIRDDDATQIDESLSGFLLYPIAILNGLFDDNRVPTFSSDTQEPDDLAVYADAVPKLVDVGMKIPVRYIHAKLKIPEPDGDEPVLTKTQQPTPPLQQAAMTALAGEITQPDIDSSPITSMTDQLSADVSDEIKSWIDMLFAKLSASEDLPAFRDALLNSFGNLDEANMIKRMTLAYTIAELSGRFDVQQESGDGA